MLALMAFTMLALVTFTVLALMAFFTLMLATAVVFFTFALVVALLALHKSNALKDEVLLLIKAEVCKVSPSSLHFFALGLHLSTFGFTFSLGFLSHLGHFVHALVTFSFHLSLLGFHLGIHLCKEIESLLVQISLGCFFQFFPLGIFSLQGTEGAVMFLSDDGVLSGGFLRLLLRSVVASHHKEAGKTHH